MSKGKIIFLNGTSSSGKTSIAKTLQEILDEAYMHVSVDTFLLMLPDQYLMGEKQKDFSKLIPIVISGMHHSIKALASRGNNIIVDHVFERKEWLKECVELLIDFPIFFVGVHCPLEILEQRENERKNRQIGLAKYQFERVHIHKIYDIEVDTSVYNPMECALQIKDFLQKESYSAFKEINTTYITD